MNEAIRKTFLNILAYLLLSFFSFLILRMIAEYYPLNDHVGFLKYKQAYLDNGVWKACFYIHVFSSFFILFAGFTQFSPYILNEHKKWHRLAGRLYVINVLFINFPCAMVMAIYANGLLPSKTAFVILDILWFWFTLKAVTSAREKDFETHKNYMIRSYALTLSALSLRTWKIILVHTTTLDPLSIYMMQAWLGFVPNLLLAEFIIRRKKIGSLSLKRNREEQYQ